MKFQFLEKTIRIATFGVFFFFINNVSASDSLALKKSELHYELAENLGKAVVNHPAFPKVGISQLTEFSLLRQCNGAETWHQYYHFPETGVSFLFGTLGNRKVLGNVFASYAFINFENKSKKKLVIQRKIGFGFAYFNKPYNIQNNTENIVIGSHITAVASFVLGFKYRLTERLSLSAGASYFHFSNAHYQLPNLGLNSINMQAALTYYPYKRQNQYAAKSAPERNRNFHLNVKLGLGINERGGTLGPSNGPKYPIYLASVFLTKRYSYKGNFQVGVEANYNTGAHDYIVSNDVFSAQEKLKSSTSIFFLGHEFMWKHLSFVLQGGVFIYNPLYREIINNQRTISTKEHLKSWFTTKFGFQYYLFDTYKKYKNQIYLGSYVKANLGQADYWETSIGYTF